MRCLNVITPNAAQTFITGKGSRMLSASSIKEYVNCPLMFYFNKIERLRASDDDADFMDASTFGTIVHDTLQHLYYPSVRGRHARATIE